MQDAFFEVPINDIIKEMSIAMTRRVFGFGVWLVDYVKDIEYFPPRNELSYIYSEIDSGGGGSFNVLMDLAGLDNNLELYACGRWGDDVRGSFLEQELHKRKIDTSLIKRVEKCSTTYTIVLSEISTGVRSFLFHDTKIDDEYDISDFDKLLASVKKGDVFYIGYINFVQGMMKHEAELYKQLLPKLVEKGVCIVADYVSVDKNNDSFTVLKVALPYLDVLLVNEVELSFFNGETYRMDGVIDHEKLANGMKMITKDYQGTLIVHFPEGAYICSGNNTLFVPSFNIKKEQIAGSVGAGDAFCAGVINAILDEKEAYTIVEEAHAMAYFSLQDKTSVGKVVSIETLRNFIETRKKN